MGTNTKGILKKLLKAGFKELRQEGSHKTLVKGNRKLTLPYHPTKDLGKGLIKKLEKDSGVKLT